MRDAALPVLACHMVQHEMFLSQFRHGLTPLKQGDWKGVRSFLVDRLPANLSRHISTADRVAADMLRRQRYSPRNECAAHS